MLITKLVKEVRKKFPLQENTREGHFLTLFAQGEGISDTLAQDCSALFSRTPVLIFQYFLRLCRHRYYKKIKQPNNCQ